MYNPEGAKWAGLSINRDTPNMAGEEPFVVDFTSDSCESSLVGGKAKNLWRLSGLVDGTSAKVPAWFCITTKAFSCFVQVL